MRSLHFMATVLLVASCGDNSDATIPPTDPAALMATLTDLAAFGNKRVGTAAGAQAGDYVKMRMEAIGLTNVHFETFQFPRQDITSKTMALTVAGAPVTPPFALDVFEASAPGHADGDVVYVHDATDAALTGIDLTGKVALVERNAFYHRSTQYRNVIAKGAVAMLYVSAAPNNLIQVGSVKRDWETTGLIPAVTIGADDGQMLITAATANQPIHATIDVTGTSTPSVGRNVVGTIPGVDPTHEMVIGAHYDTWFTGSTDNGGGVAAVLAMAARRLREPQPPYTLVFVCYDGEEVALYGGYHFLRTHLVQAGESILTVLNFEMPAAVNVDFAGLGHSTLPSLDDALQDAGLRTIYALYVDMESVPMLFGGIIPTDIQGIYRSGVPTASTASDSPYYHTTADTPDKVDTTELASSVDDFDVALGFLLALPAPTFATPDSALWRAAVTQTKQADGSLAIDATITDASGTVQPSAPTRVVLLYDDFFLAGAADLTTDVRGQVHASFPAAQVALGSGRRFVHVTAGPTWPIVEQIIAIP